MKIVEHELAYYSWKLSKGDVAMLKEGMLYCISCKLALVEDQGLDSNAKLAILMDERMIFEIKKGRKYTIKALDDMVVVGVSKEELMNYIYAHSSCGDFIAMIIEGITNSTMSLIDQIQVLECKSAKLRVRLHLQLYGECYHLSDVIRSVMTNTSRETCCRARIKLLKGE